MRPSSHAVARRPVIGIPADYAPMLDDDQWHPRWQLNETYVSAVFDAGGLPVVIPVIPMQADQLMEMLDGVILSGGGDIDPAIYGQDRHPETDGITAERDDLELRVFAAARERHLPILGICRGIQLINVGMGGTLIQDIPTRVDSTIQHRQHLAGLGRDDVSHPVALDPGSRIAAIYGTPEIMTNTYHHQALDRVADGLVVTGRAADGVIESAEAPGDDFLVAVQWHPETLYRRYPEHAAPFQALVSEARAFSLQRLAIGPAR